MTRQTMVGTGRSTRDHIPTLDLAVNLGFGVLLLVCGFRYFAYHELSGTGIPVLALAIATGASYAWAVIGTERPDQPAGATTALRTRQGLGILIATALWLPLVVLAPSFGWCAFALFFAVHRVLTGRVAFVLTGIIVVSVSLGLLLMSAGEDLGLVLGPFFGGLVLSYAYWALDRSLAAQRTLIADLVDTRAQLARSEREAGALLERERVASELHDTVVQSTASALLLLESTDQDPPGADHAADTRATVREAKNTLRTTLADTRQLLHGLAQPRATAPSLSEAIAALAAAHQARFVSTGTEQYVPEELRHALSRITQEALLNVAKHAGPASVQVTLSFFPDAVGVDIADTGSGFTPNATHQSLPVIQQGAGSLSARANGDSGDGAGFGIRAMTWRATSLGGELTIESQPGAGTVVAAVLPLTTDSEDPA